MKSEDELTPEEKAKAELEETIAKLEEAKRQYAAMSFEEKARLPQWMRDFFRGRRETVRRER